MKSFKKIAGWSQSDLYDLLESHLKYLVKDDDDCSNSDDVKTNKTGVIMYKKIDKYITGLTLDSEDVIISVAHTQP